jgi:endonuclease-3
MKMEKHLKQLSELGKFGKDMRLAAEEWKNDYETLISIALSARTMDETTIPVSKKLFKRFPNVKSLANAKLSDIQKIIRPVNFYKNKSRNIKACAKMLESVYNGKVPHDFDSLISLPGVGRKTANVFLSEKGKPSIGVDTHVAYISKQLGWTSHSAPEKIEKDLKAMFPKGKWSKVNSTLVRFGKTHTSRKKKNEVLKWIRKIK